MSAQNNGLGFIYPLDRDPSVTGNYGEIRPNHFHAGLDFSTDAVKNLPIKSVGDGYVSRIKISSVGYGKVLYITHANGYVSVYAHQKRYADKIDAYIKQKQLQQQKNEIEVYPDKHDLPVKQDEVIGYTGNSGGSSGPHLHFEIREEKSEIPINPLIVYTIKDNVKPVLTHVAIYNTSDTNTITQQTVSLINTKTGKLSIPKNTFVLKQNTFAIAFAGYDAANATTNKNNIYEAKLQLDGQLIYHHQLNNISFDNGRYVNYFSEKSGNIKFQKCFTPACYDIGIYKTLVNGGKIELKDTLLHTVELTVADEKGNSNKFTFYVKAKNLSGYNVNTTKYNVFCNKEFTLKKEDFEIKIPAGSLVHPAFVTKRVYIKAPVGGGIDVGNKNDKVIKAFQMALKIKTPIKNKESKLVMKLNDDAIGGKYEDGWLKADCKSFGNFNYMYDTIAPSINCTLAKKKQANIGAYKSISFRVNDNISGVGEYNLYINDFWQIAEYDAKSDIITCYFDNKAPTGKITIRLEVLDKVGNKGSLEISTVR